MRPPPLATDNLAFLHWLREHHLTDEEVRAVEAWWIRHRVDEQTLADFLMSQHVINRSAGPALTELVAGGVCGDVFTVHGLEHLREQLGAVEPTPAPLHDTTPSDATQTPTHPDVGSTLGRCLLTEQIGRGATGVVFRALHRTLNMPVAIKVLNPTLLARNPAIARQIKSEARLLAQLNHPHVVRVWDFEDTQFPYLVLEYVPGLSLSELIQQSGRVHPMRALRLISQAAEGLAAAYKLGIVHRDVKPANILVTRDGTAKLADLGMAMVVDVFAESRQRGVAGTVAYMAPEQALPNAVLDHRADIYALGATLYHTLTGRLPFPAATRVEVLYQHAHSPLVPPHSLSPDIDPSVSELVAKMMAKNPIDRFANYDELIRALTSLEAAMANLPGQKWANLAQSKLATTGPKPAAASQSTVWVNLKNRINKPAEGG